MCKYTVMKSYISKSHFEDVQKIESTLGIILLAGQISGLTLKQYGSLVIT